MAKTPGAGNCYFHPVSGGFFNPPHNPMTKEEKANEISDTIVKLAITEKSNGTPGAVVVVGTCLGLLGVLAGGDNGNHSVALLIKQLHATIKDLTHRKPTFTDIQ